MTGPDLLTVTGHTLFHHEPRAERPENVNTKYLQSLKVQDRMAVNVTAALGTMWAVYFFAIFMAIWMISQIVAGRQAIDPYPFAFLLFITNIVQLLLMPLIMVGQKVLERHAELRADEQYKTTMRSYLEMEHLMAHLDAQDKELLRQSQMLSRLLQARQMPTDSMVNHAVPPPDGL